MGSRAKGTRYARKTVRQQEELSLLGRRRASLVQPADRGLWHLDRTVRGAFVSGLQGQDCPIPERNGVSAHRFATCLAGRGEDRITLGCVGESRNEDLSLNHSGAGTSNP